MGSSFGAEKPVDGVAHPTDFVAAMHAVMDDSEPPPGLRFSTQELEEEQEALSARPLSRPCTESRVRDTANDEKPLNTQQ